MPCLVGGITINGALITGADGSKISSVSTSRVSALCLPTGDVSTSMHIQNDELQDLSDLGKGLADHKADVDFLGAGNLTTHKDFSFCRHNLTGPQNIVLLQALVRMASAMRSHNLSGVSADTLGSFINVHIKFLSLPSRRSITSSCGVAAVFCGTIFFTIW